MRETTGKIGPECRDTRRARVASRRRRGLLALSVGLLGVPALALSGTLTSAVTRHKIALPSHSVQRVNGLQCGLVGGRWLPGQALTGRAGPGRIWFITRAQQAANYRAVAKISHPQARARMYFARAAVFQRLAIAGTRPGHGCAILDAAATPPRPAVDPVVPMPSGNLPGWTQVFADDFSQTVPVGTFPAAVAGLWGTYSDGTGTTSVNLAPFNGLSKGLYWPSKTVSQAGGNLLVHVHSEAGLGASSSLLPTEATVPLGAAVLPIVPGAPGPAGGQTYGRYTLRFKVDPVPGFKTAVLLWPDSGDMSGDTNSAGEIDFPEFNYTSTIFGHFHRRYVAGYPPPNTADFRAVNTGIAASSGWHIATITWLPNSLTYDLDGQTVLTVNGAVVPNTPMHMVIQTEPESDDATLPPAAAAGNLSLDWLVISAPS